LDFLHEGSLHQRRVQQANFCHFGRNNCLNLPNFISNKRRARFYTAIHRSSTKFSRFVHTNATFVGYYEQETSGNIPFLVAFPTLMVMMGALKGFPVSRQAKSLTGE
jgi:hypothetical protein